MLKVFHNPRCRKSCEGLKYLDGAGAEYTVRQYLADPLTRDEIDEILLKSNLTPLEIIRTDEALFKKEFKGKNFTPDEWKTILVENPRLLQRPVVVGRYKAVIGRPASNIQKVLS